MLNIGILKADSVREEFQATHGDYPAMISEVLAEAFRALGTEVLFHTYDVEHGHYPDTLDACDGYVISGSRQSVYDEDAWISQLGQFVQRLHARQIKIVGLCFGHQLIAQYLGGETTSAEVGWNVGVQSSEVTQPAWFMKPPLDHYELIVSHRDQVTTLPYEANLLAVGSQCAHSMYTIGSHILAMQGHPEFDSAYSATLMQFREDILGREKFERGVASLATPLSRQTIASWIACFLSDSPPAPAIDDAHRC